MSNYEEETPIRILHILGALDRGGAETMVMNLYRNIDRSKIQFDFLIHTEKECDYSNEIRSLGGKIYSLKRFKGYNVKEYVLQFNNFFKEHHEYSIVHGHMRSTASIYLLIAKKYNIYTIAHSHNTSSGKGLSAIGKNILQYPLRFIADYYFACSIEAGKWLFGTKIVQSTKFSVLKNAIDIDKFIFNSNIRKQKREEFGLENKFIIGNVGRFHEQKNHIFMIKLFDIFLKKNHDACLLLIGEGELKKEIKDLVNSLNIKDKVIFLDSRSDVNEIMMAFDVFIFPSKYEGLGIVAIEAQCSSLPVICSEKVPLEVKITDNIQFVSINDINQWLEKLERIRNEKRPIVNKEELMLCGYDIKITSSFLTSFYININKEGYI